MRPLVPDDCESPAPSENGDGLLQRLPEQWSALQAFVRLNLPPDVRMRESCSDLAQSVCREVLERQHEFEWRGPEAFRAWLFEWALHKIRDRVKFHRAQKRSPRRECIDDADGLRELCDSIGTPSEDAIAREDAALLAQAIDRLDEQDRQVIGLCRIAGLSRTEVARILGKTPGAVRTQLTRALVRLGAELERLGAGG